MKINIQDEFQISISNSGLFLRVGEEKHPRALILQGFACYSCWLLVKTKRADSDLCALIIFEDGEAADTWLKNQGKEWEIVHKSDLEAIEE